MCGQRRQNDKDSSRCLANKEWIVRSVRSDDQGICGSSRSYDLRSKKRTNQNIESIGDKEVRTTTYTTIITIYLAIFFLLLLFSS